jgi:hypothetical protein
VDVVTDGGGVVVHKPLGGEGGCVADGTVVVKAGPVDVVSQQMFRLDAATFEHTEKAFEQQIEIAGLRPAGAEMEVKVFALSDFDDDTVKIVVVEIKEVPGSLPPFVDEAGTWPTRILYVSPRKLLDCRL